MEEKKSTIVKNSFINLINLVFNAISSFIIQVVLIRKFSIEEYGIYAQVVWTVSLICVFIGWGISSVTLIKYIAEYQGRQQRQQIDLLLNLTLKIEIIIAFFITLLLIAFSGRIADFYFNPEVSIVFIAAFLGILPGISYSVLGAALEGLQKFKYITYYGLVVGPLSIFLQLMFLFLGYKIVPILLVKFVFSVLNAFYYFICLKLEGIEFNWDLRIPFNKLKAIFAFNFQVIYNDILNIIVWSKSELFFLGRFCSATQVALYNFTFSFSSRFTNLIPQLIWKTLMPVMSEFHGSKDENRLKRTYYLCTRYVMFFTIPICTIGIVLAYPLIRFIYGERYVPAENILQIMFFVSLFTPLGTTNAIVLYGKDNLKFINVFGTMVAVLVIIMDVILIRKFGAWGAAIGNGIGQIIGSLGGTLYACRRYHLPFPFKSILKISMVSFPMGLTMISIVKIYTEIGGFIFSIFSGIIVYIILSYFLGTIEKEDRFILRKVAAIFPDHQQGKIVDFIDQFFTKVIKK